MVQTTHFSFISTNQHFRDVKQFYVGRAILGLEANCLQALQFLSNWNKDLFIEIYMFLVVNVIRFATPWGSPLGVDV